MHLPLPTAAAPGMTGAAHRHRGPDRSRHADEPADSHDGAERLANRGALRTRRF